MFGVVFGGQVIFDLSSFFFLSTDAIISTFYGDKVIKVKRKFIVSYETTFNVCCMNV